MSQLNILAPERYHADAHNPTKKQRRLYRNITHNNEDILNIHSRFYPKYKNNLLNINIARQHKTQHSNSKLIIISTPYKKT